MSSEANGSVTCLLGRVTVGDAEAFQRLWERYIETLIRLARGKLSPKLRAMADEEDLALSAFNSFCRGAANGRFPRLDDRLDLWRVLVTITRCKAADYANREKRRVRTIGEGDLDEIAGPAPTPEFAAMMAEQVSRLLEGLRDETLRRVALLKLEGYTDEEIAIRLSCAPADGGARARPDPREMARGGTGMSDDSVEIQSSWPTSPDDLVDLACDRFEAAWRAGRRPLIEEHLDQVAEPLRELLLRELLLLELDLRRDEGPNILEYEQRFPRHLELIEEVFSAHPSVGWPILSPGETITARYEIIEMAGRGGMGLVYKARDRTLDRPVAIKCILGGGSTQRLLREAQLLAKVDSPHVVRIHDYLVRDGLPMLIMGWVDGEDLSRKIKGRGGPIPEEEVLRWMKDTCRGMVAAEGLGIIHRDLKPSNILIDEAGRARVADFGLARIPALSGDLTRSWNLIGTAPYMSPEQARSASRGSTQRHLQLRRHVLPRARRARRLSRGDPSSMSSTATSTGRWRIR